jgi:hypothetical protein
VLTQKYDIEDVSALTSGTGFDAFRRPAGAELVNVRVLVVTASDATITGVVKLTDGISDIVTGFDVTSAANSYLSLTNGDGAVADAALMLAPASGADETLQLVYTETGTAATEGRMVVYLDYIQKA